MNRPSQKSQRFVFASLLLAVVITAMVAPNIIDIYTGAPRIQLYHLYISHLPTIQ
jgi:hypothetical protein